jgi:peptidyl-prolyl cis-trans isomerase SurA
MQFLSKMTTATFPLLKRAAKFVIYSALVLSGESLAAQESADKILIVVGRNRIILQSDLEKAAGEARQQDPGFNDSSKCLLLQQMVMQKMLMEQAERDSISVTEEDVEGQLDNRLRYFVQLYGSKEKLEQLTGKTVYQIKEEFRDMIKEQMVAEKMQGQILENIKITPAEVADFYKKIPVDSLPFFPATIEAGQIVIAPAVSLELDEYAHKQLEDIRKKITDKEISFEDAAIRYSEDPGSRDNGGRYDGITRNGPWAQEFITATFKLQAGEISPIFKTKFGYHILQVVNRKGDEADVRHILIKPAVSSSDFKVAINKLDSVRNLLSTGKIGFSEAVGKFSTDEGAKRTGGMIADPSTGATDLDITKLDPGMVMMLDSLEPGQYSKAHIYVNELHEQSCRIIYLRNRTSPHKANLKDDYNRIQEVALAQKKQLKMQAWLKARLPTFYVKIDKEYEHCPSLKELKLAMTRE